MDMLVFPLTRTYSRVGQTTPNTNHAGSSREAGAGTAGRIVMFQSSHQGEFMNLLHSTGLRRSSIYNLRYIAFVVVLFRKSYLPQECRFQLLRVIWSISSSVLPVSLPQGQSRKPLFI